LKLADSHIHLFEQGYPGRYDALFPAGDLPIYEKIREAHGIGRALVVGFEGEPWARGNNRYIARLAKDRPWIVPLTYSDPSCDLTKSKLEEAWVQGFAGLSLYTFKREEVDILNTLPPEAIDSLNEHRAIISLNSTPEIAGKMRPFFERLPSTRILLSHLGMPEGMTGAIRQLRPVLALADLPHVGIKVSGAYALNSYPHSGLRALVGKLQAAFGESRLYWGSDFCPALDSVSFTQTLELGLPTGFLSRRIFEGNLQRIINRVKGRRP
jgi:L-fuconolactonase